MKKFPIFPIIVVVAAFALSILAARSVENARVKLVDKPERLSRVYLPHLGIDRFVADLKWVKLVQEMGWHAQQKMTKNAAVYFADAADSITDLDPDMAVVYQMVALHITHEAPKRAIDLLRKARRYALDQDWRWSFYGGHIAERYLPKANVPEADCQAQAEAFYAEACGMSGHAPYVERAWMRCATKSAGEDPVKRLLAGKSFVLRLKAKAIGRYGSPDSSGVETTGFTDETTEGPYFRLRGIVLAQAREVTGDLLDQFKVEKNAAKKEVLRRKLEEARGVFDVFKPGGYICSICLTAYGPGRFHCSNCSHKIEAYGYCSECWAKGRLVLFGGAYCHICGAKTP